MSKVAAGPRILLNPLPVVLIGVNIDGKPNFLTAGACGIACTDPPMISVAIRPIRYSEKGIRQSMTFSINLPSSDIVRETDYCGLVSGAEISKAEACGFDVFYGKLQDVPLIKQCPVNMECSVAHVLELGSHTLFIGQIVESHISEDCMTYGKLDIDKLQPLAVAGQPPDGHYYTLGDVIAKVYRAGLDLKRGEQV